MSDDEAVEAMVLRRQRSLEIAISDPSERLRADQHLRQRIKDLAGATFRDFALRKKAAGDVLKTGLDRA